MQTKNNIPLYTPSVLAPETLKEMFVKREKLLTSLCRKHKESVLTNDKYFSLLVGPRGMGKTHLISMLFNELKQDKALENNMLLTWLREEEWGISSYLDLLIQILRNISNEYNTVEATDIDTLYEKDSEDAEYTAEKLLESLLSKNKVLVLLAENLNFIFEGIGVDGQEKLRALIQNTGKISIAAATQSLFSSVTSRSKPFYGFFTVTHLEKFTLQDAIQLLINIAGRDDNTALVDVLNTQEGQARIRALHHLAGGNPRIYVLFSQFIQADTLDEFTGPMMKMLDELTPYYQAKMLELSAQQRKIIMFLCRESGAITVQTLAKKNHITQQTASSQLKKLKESGFVESAQYGRQSYYEIAEPLLRMVLSVKDNRGAPVRLAIDLIRHFFTVTELKQIQEQPEINLLGIKCLTEDIINSAIESASPNPHVIAAIKDFELAFINKNYAEVERIIKELNNDNIEGFIERFINLLVKFFQGSLRNSIDITKQLLPIVNGKDDLQQAILIVLLLVLNSRQKIISSRHFIELFELLTDEERHMLALTIFESNSSFVKAIKCYKNNQDPLIIQFIECSLYILFDVISTKWVINLVEFIENSSSYDYFPVLIPYVLGHGDKMAGEKKQEILNVLVNAETFDETHLSILLTISAKVKDNELLRHISDFMDDNSQFEGLHSFKETIITYVQTQEPKELLALPKEFRSLILGNNGTESIGA